MHKLLLLLVLRVQLLQPCLLPLCLLLLLLVLHVQLLQLWLLSLCLLLLLVLLQSQMTLLHMAEHLMVQLIVQLLCVLVLFIAMPLLSWGKLRLLLLRCCNELPVGLQQHPSRRQPCEPKHVCRNHCSCSARHRGRIDNSM